jgi:hypothetical protein
MAAAQTLLVHGGRPSVVIDTRELRLPALGMIAAGVLLPILGHPGIACPLRTLTGIPCPLCGASTSVEDALRGHIVAALRASPLGVVALGIAVFSIASRRRFISQIPLVAVVAVLTCAWVFQLFRFSVL